MDNHEKILERLREAYGVGTQNGVNPTSEQWRRLVTFPYDGVLVTNQFAKFAANFLSDEVQKASEAYASVTARILPELGVEVQYEGRYGTVLFGHTDEDWDFVGMIKFPNRAALLGMFLHPDYIAVHGARDLMMERYRMVITYPPFTYPASWSSNH
jgi:hypothetical protein